MLDGVLLELLVGTVFFAIDAAMAISHRELTPSDLGISLFWLSTFLEVTNARSARGRDEWGKICFSGFGSVRKGGLNGVGADDHSCGVLFLR